jgi:cell division transport system permease protein
MMARNRQNFTLIAALSALLVIALGGAFGAGRLAAHWQLGTGLAVQVPQPGQPGKNGQTRQEAVLAALRATPGISAARPLSEGEMADLLRPWLGRLGENVSLPMPGIIVVQLGGPPADLAALARQLSEIAPGSVLEAPTHWRAPVLVAAQRLRIAALVVAAFVGLAAFIAIAGAATGQQSQDGALLHALGAADRVILARAPGRFWRAVLAGLFGAVIAAGALIGLHGLLAPLAGLAARPDPLAPLADLSRIAAPDWSAAFWAALAAVPLAVALVDGIVARASLRRWVRRLP